MDGRGAQTEEGQKKGIKNEGVREKGKEGTGEGR